MDYLPPPFFLISGSLPHKTSNFFSKKSEHILHAAYILAGHHRRKLFHLNNFVCTERNSNPMSKVKNICVMSHHVPPNLQELSICVKYAWVLTSSLWSFTLLRLASSIHCYYLRHPTSIIAEFNIRFNSSVFWKKFKMNKVPLFVYKMFVSLQFCIEHGSFLVMDHRPWSMRYCEWRIFSK